MHLDTASGKKTRQPKSVAPSFMGQDHPSNLPTGRRAPGLQTLDKRNQPVAACIQHMPRMPINSRQLNRQNPLLTAIDEPNSGVVPSLERFGLVRYHGGDRLHQHRFGFIRWGLARSQKRADGGDLAAGSKSLTRDRIGAGRPPRTWPSDARQKKPTCRRMHPAHASNADQLQAVEPSEPTSYGH